MKALKKFIRNLEYSLKSILLKDYLAVDYAVKRNNFGDILNKYLIESITNKKILRVSSFYYDKKHLLAIGSILNRATSKSIIWGAGFIEENSKTLGTPYEVLAVRGPKTRQRLIELGISCPEVYGDPALLIPEYYNPKIETQYKLGIIPHYVDKDHISLASLEDISILVIDICNPNPLKVIDQLLSCKNIASSSLHGLIVSDAYGIPNVRVKFSEKITGGDFKFEDYYLSINQEITEPIRIENNLDINAVISNAKKTLIKIDLDKLKVAIINYYNIAN